MVNLRSTINSKISTSSTTKRGRLDLASRHFFKRRNSRQLSKEIAPRIKQYPQALRLRRDEPLWIPHSSLNAPDYYILWDWFNTLVKLNGNMEVKPGIQDFFERSSGEGIEGRPFGHLVTTKSCGLKIGRMVEGSGLLNFVGEIFDRNNSGKAGKFYGPLVDHIGIPIEKVGAQAVVVGDRLRDLPLDAPDLVLILEPDGWKRPINRIETLLCILLQAGHGNFFEGFRKLFEQGESAERQHPNLNWKRLGDERSITLGELSMQLAYIGPPNENSTDSPKTNSNGSPVIALFPESV